MKTLLAFTLSFSLVFQPMMASASASRSQVDLVRKALKDLGLASNISRPTILSVYKKAERDFQPETRRWLEPLVTSIKNFTVGDMSSKVIRGAAGQEIFQFVVKAPTGDIALELIPSSDSQPLKINGIPMPESAWFSEKSFEEFVDAVILDSETASHKDKDQKKFAQMISVGLLLNYAHAGPAEDMWTDISGQVCLDVSDLSADCENSQGQIKIFGETPPETLRLAFENNRDKVIAKKAKASQVAKLTEQMKKKFKDLERQIEKSKEKPVVEVTNEKPSPPPAKIAAPAKKKEKKSAKAKPELPKKKAPERKVASVLTEEMPTPVAQGEDPNLARKSSRYQTEAENLAVRKAEKISMMEIYGEENLGDDGSVVELISTTTGKKKKASAPKPEVDTVEEEDHSASLVPAPVVEISQAQVSDDEESFANRSKKMTAQKTDTAAAAAALMALAAKISKKRAPSIESESAAQMAPAPAVRLISPDKLLSPVKPRKRSGGAR